MSYSRCAIATWFVADGAEDATYFPQVSQFSDSRDAQDVYWRCVLGFYASSLAVNGTDCSHVFFTNTEIPNVDGIDIGEMLVRWGVKIIDLPITRRLPPNSVSMWGNQFYVFDCLSYWANRGEGLALILLDSDCVWIRPAIEMLALIENHGALTYQLEYPPGASINGLSTAGMARFLRDHSPIDRKDIPYYGGEIVAVSFEMAARLADDVERLWPAVSESGIDSPREEAHLLSVIYAMEGVIPGTANRFIKRIWTTFRHHNADASDLGLTIWHLPGEKRTGFYELFRAIVRNSELDPSEDAQHMSLGIESYSRIFGIPRRDRRKLVVDIFRGVGIKLRPRRSPV